MSEQPPEPQDPYATPAPGATPPSAPPPASGTPAPPPAAYGTTPPSYGTPPPPPAYGSTYGAPAYTGPVGAKVPNNMGLAITSLVVGLCCGGLLGLATGIVSLVFASQVNGKAAVGDVAGATSSAAKARLWAIITFVIAAIGIVIGVIYFAANRNNLTTS